jgi:hypothetical protein
MVPGKPKIVEGDWEIRNVCVSGYTFIELWAIQKCSGLLEFLSSRIKTPARLLFLEFPTANLT